jgi:hypothetical protein
VAWLAKYTISRTARHRRIGRRRRARGASFPLIVAGWLGVRRSRNGPSRNWRCRGTGAGAHRGCAPMRLSISTRLQSVGGHRTAAEVHPHDVDGFLDGPRGDGRSRRSEVKRRGWRVVGEFRARSARVLTGRLWRPANNMLSLVQADLLTTSPPQIPMISSSACERIQAVEPLRTSCAMNEKGREFPRRRVRQPAAVRRPSSALLNSPLASRACRQRPEYVSTDAAGVHICRTLTATPSAGAGPSGDGSAVCAPTRRGLAPRHGTMAEGRVTGAVDLDCAPPGLSWRLTCPAANALEFPGAVAREGRHEGELSRRGKIRRAPRSLFSSEIFARCQRIAGPVTAFCRSGGPRDRVYWPSR